MPHNKKDKKKCFEKLPPCEEGQVQPIIYIQKKPKRGHTGPTGPTGLAGLGNTGPTGPTGPSVLHVKNTVFVDATFGTVSGVPQDESKPFQTIAQGLAAIPPHLPTDSWQVVIRPGNYPETIRELALTNINYVDIVGSGTSTIVQQISIGSTKTVTNLNISNLSLLDPGTGATPITVMNSGNNGTNLPTITFESISIISRNGYIAPIFNITDSWVSATLITVNNKTNTDQAGFVNITFVNNVNRVNFDQVDVNVVAYVMNLSGPIGPGNIITFADSSFKVIFFNTNINVYSDLTTISSGNNAVSIRDVYHEINSNESDPNNILIYNTNDGTPLFADCVFNTNFLTANPSNSIGPASFLGVKWSQSIPSNNGVPLFQEMTSFNGVHIVTGFQTAVTSFTASNNGDTYFILVEDTTLRLDPASVTPVVLLPTTVPFSTREGKIVIIINKSGLSATIQDYDDIPIDTLPTGITRIYQLVLGTWEIISTT